MSAAAHAAAEAFHRLAEADRAAAVAETLALHDAFARAGVLFDGAPMRSFLRPHFVSAGDWRALARAGRLLVECAARAARHAFGGELGRLLDFLGTPEAERPWLAIDAGEPDVVISRVDAFLAPDGPRVIEINSDAPAGLGYSDRMARVFEASPLFRRFAEGRPLRYVPSGPGLIGALRRHHVRQGGGGEPRVAIVDWSDVKTRPDQELLREGLLRAGLDCRLADPRELEERRGRLSAGGFEVDLVYRRALLQELVARPDEARGFLAAYRARPGAFVNGFRCRISEDKAFLALLGDDAHAQLWSAEERAALEAIVPWTRRLEERRTTRRGVAIDLVPHVLAERERLVLKPAHDYGGRDVMLGDAVDDPTWRRQVEAALAGAPWVVQERVAIPEEVFPVVSQGRLAFEALKVNVNPFYVEGAEVGAVARVSRSAVINVSAGGGSVPCFVVD